MLRVRNTLSQGGSSRMARISNVMVGGHAQKISRHGRGTNGVVGG
jgi:hypothetical protein